MQKKCESAQKKSIFTKLIIYFKKTNFFASKDKEERMKSFSLPPAGGVLPAELCFLLRFGFKAAL